uniref:NADH-ubiquinone oxidoreductase chain 2 n=1 Tax=Lineus viridis TaxID=56195 RepID=C6GCT5_9BILA|nr:NADH dehydrogenase subunit 2 [Lineus viridis]ACO40324.1 NADH dehydrogenase subunit 2 [Lineus viridis]
MFLSFPFSFGFGVLCTAGSVISMSSGDWLGVWLGLEINLLGFIPLMVQAPEGQSVEAAIKYFVVQAVGSGFLLLGALGEGNFFFWWFPVSGSFSPGLFFCVVGLVLKLGVAPFHWWVPSVMGGLSWFGCSFLMTWQKLAPFFILLSLSSLFVWFFLFLGCLSSVVGGLMGIGQVQVRVLMAYSSISHWGWILGLLSFSFLCSFFYFFVYFFITVVLFYFLSCQNLARTLNIKGVLGSFTMVGFLSLGGLPPMTGFLPKWVGLQLVCSYSSFFLLSFLVVGSLLSLYYYLSFLFVFFVENSGSYFFYHKKFFGLLMGMGLVFLALGFPFYEFFYCWVGA